MFSGIISELGKIKDIVVDDLKKKDLVVIVSTKLSPSLVKIGDSISCNGICLTLTKIEEGALFNFDISKETLSITTSKKWQIGDLLNIELSTKMGDVLGGHLVTGHVDGLSELLNISKSLGSCKMVFSMPKDLSDYIIKKGSIAIDGISLTVNKVSSNSFEVNIIAHTLSETTLGKIRIGDKVNIEVDIISRYAVSAVKKYVKRN